MNKLNNSSQSLTQRIIANALSSPNAYAVIDNKSHTTYRQLTSSAFEIADYLQSIGLIEEEGVAICSGREVEFVAGILGIMLAGGSYVPIDPQQPSSRISDLFKKAKIRFILGTPSELRLLSQVPQTLIPITIVNHPNRRSSKEINNHNNSNKLAYQLFTSGSTGTPKMVSIEHQSVCALLDGMDEIAPLSGSNVATSVSPFSFDVSVWELFSSLTKGGVVHILDREKTKDPVYFVEYILNHSVTSAYIPPFLLDHLIENFYTKKTVGELKRILVGVEPILQGTLQKLRDLSPDLSIINGYGPTEATVCATLYPFKQAEERDRRTPIGWPVKGLKIDIVDEKLQSVPPGEIGQIIISGIGLARGYAHSPEETAKSFIERPSQGRWYLTGDLGRTLPSGAIEFIGRDDQQVKIRGFRIELMEIEATLKQHPHVSSALVLAPPGAQGRRLTAFVISSESASELRRYLFSLLPSYMVPSRLIIVKKFPVNENGKIDRKKLLEKARYRPLATTIIPPKTPLEKKWTEIWAEILDLDSVGMEDNFFELGGDSVLALLVSRRMAEACDAPHLSTLFLHCKTLTDASKLFSMEFDVKAMSRTDIEKYEGKSSFPLSFGQKGLWTFQMMNKENSAFVLPIIFRIDGNISQTDLLHSLEELIRRHEVFRLSYQLSGNKVEQLFSQEKPKILLSSSPIPVSSLDSQLTLYFQQDAKELLSLNAPPCAIRILSVDNGDKVVLISIHHIAFDGSSLPILVSELSSLLNGEIENSIPHGPSQFASSQEARIGKPLWMRDKAYWLNLLTPLPEALELPIDHPRLPQRTGRGQILEQLLSKEAAEQIDILARKCGETPFRIIFSLLGLLAYRLSGQDDFVVSTPVSIRPMENRFARSIGYFVNLLPIRFRFEKNQPLNEFLKNISESFGDCYSHSNFPFEEMLRELFQGQNNDHTRFNRFIVAQEVDSGLPCHTKKGNIYDYFIDPATSMYELTVFVAEKEGGYRLRWQFDSDIYSAAIILHLQEMFNNLLFSAANSPHAPLHELAILSESKQQEIWAKSSEKSPSEILLRSIVDLFDENVRLSPNSIAVEDSFSQKIYSYEKLSSLSHVCANRLQEAKVQNEVPVLVFAKRSPEFIAAILGILRAGGYYIPVDDRVPIERIKYICDVCQVKHAVGDIKGKESLSNLLVFSYDDLLSGTKSREIVSPRHAESLSYVMFTSGSTGEPKGVAICDRGIVRLVREQNFAQFSNKDAFGLLSNLAFDAVTLEIWGALLNGGRLVIPDEKIVRDPTQLPSFIHRTGVTAGFFNVTAFRQMINAEASSLKKMNTILVGGENVPDSLFVQAAKTLDYHTLVNGYGPTENTTFSCCYRLSTPPSLGKPIPIGKAISHSSAIVVDENLRPLPIGVKGEILVGGAGLARGYIGKEKETRERFVTLQGNRFYHTGDLGRVLPSGDIVYLGRRDNQVKVRGFRIELSEIETILMRQKKVRAAVVLAPEIEGIRRLEAYVEGDVKRDELKAALSKVLPEYMLPSLIVIVDKLPTNKNGKVDRSALPSLRSSISSTDHFQKPLGEIQEKLAALFQEVLHIDSVGIHDKFFDVGGNSLLLIVLAERISKEMDKSITPVDIIENPTIDSLTKIFSQNQKENRKENKDEEKRKGALIAIVGMAGRFPGANDVTTFWANTLQGKVHISAVGEKREDMVPYRAILDNTDRFDTQFFEIPEREALFIDPQQRFLLEVTQHTFDDAGINPHETQDIISAYVACAPADPIDSSSSLSEQYERTLASSPDFAATRIGYRFNLHGECITIQTGCSSSLVAVHLACQSLLSGKSDIAIAGGASFPSDQNVGYAFEEGMITSPSGICRPFDTEADGTVPGGGVGMIALMRLEDALEKRYRIRAIIRGSSLNNDGSAKMSFMAPSPAGQAQVITKAQIAAECDPSSIGYIETHGTATSIGDAVEMEGLARSFSRDSKICFPCALGSVKANCGHMDRASGIAGLIRTVMAVQEGVIPPMANFKKINPQLRMEGKKFIIPTKALPWPKEFSSRRAGVSSFGVGGTNAHIILEEAPPIMREKKDVKTVLLPFSSHTPHTLKQFLADFSRAMVGSKKEELPSIARTLISGRKSDRYRSFIISRSLEDDLKKLESSKLFVANQNPKLLMLFPGQGDAIVEGYQSLYDEEPVYRKALDHCAEIISPLANFDIREKLFHSENIKGRFADMGRFQPIMFSVQWSLTELWKSWGICPQGLLGHSFGEIVAATCAGVFQVEDALKFVALRGKLMQETVKGAMISVPKSSQWVEKRLLPNTSIAAINGNEWVVVSGIIEAMVQLEHSFAKEGVRIYPLAIYRAAHGPCMQKVGDQLALFLKEMNLLPPAIPILSNLSGHWANNSIAEPNYWAAHATSTVQFLSNLHHVATEKFSHILTIGPGKAIQQLLENHLDDNTQEVLVSEKNNREEFLQMLGRLWAGGIPANLLAHLGQPLPSMTSLPYTVFDHQKKWPAIAKKSYAKKCSSQRFAEPGAWLWKRSLVPISLVEKRKIDSHFLFTGKSSTFRKNIERKIRALGGEVAIDSQRAEKTSDIIWWPSLKNGDFFLEADSIAKKAASLSCRVWVCVVSGDERSEQPESMPSLLSLAQATSSVIPLEYPEIIWNFIDIEENSSVSEDAVLSLLQGSHSNSSFHVEKGSAFSMEYKQAWPHWNIKPLRENGCYVITGGAGLVGQALCRAIAQEVAATIILLGRSAKSVVSSRISTLVAELKKKGTRVIYQQLDITDAPSLSLYFSELRTRYHRIDGVIHAAGFTDTKEFTLLSQTDQNVVKKISKAKLKGLSSIHQALNPNEADFILLCSSLSIILGGIGFGAYISANAELNAFACLKWTQGDKRWISVAWDAWTDHSEMRQESGPSFYAIDEKEGHEIFKRVLTLNEPVIFISTGEIENRKEEARLQITGKAIQGEAITSELDASKVVAEILQEVMGKLPSDPNQDLRDEGIESLTILQIVTRLRKRTGKKIAFLDAMQALSLSGLQKLVSTSYEKNIISPNLEIVPAAKFKQYPTSSTQRRWLELMPEGYGGLDIVVQVQGQCSSDELFRAVKRVISLHSGLRTRFVKTKNKWMQVIEKKVRVSKIDLSNLNEEQQILTLRHLIEKKNKEWFDVTKKAPFEVTVAALSGKNALVLHAHHLVFDGWSSSLFLKDVARVIAKEKEKQPLQYIDFALSQNRYLNSSAIEPVRQYWKDHFKGAGLPTHFPADRIGHNADDRGTLLTFDIAAEIMDKIHARAKEHSITAFTLFFASFALLIHEVTGDFDLILGTTTAGRPLPHAENIIGVFVNPLPLRIVIDKKDTLQSYIDHVQKVLLGLHESQNYPLEDLVKHVPPFINCGLNDTFHCYLLYQNYWRPRGESLKFSNLDVKARTHHKLMREFEIVLEDHDNGVKGELWYRSSRFSEDKMQQCKERFIEWVKWVASEDWNQDLNFSRHLLSK